jgi:hypothetical protein
MRRLRLTTFLLAVAGGCRIFSPVPDMRTARDFAREVEPTCKEAPNLPRLAAPEASAIDWVGPAYSYVHSGPMGSDARLRGARIHVKPLPGFAKESLERAIECHEARVTLGVEATVAGDPYVLPDHWLQVDVESDRGGFVILLRIDEFRYASEVLDRARRFAASDAGPNAVPQP